jgi:hypothetical protein
MRLQTSLSLHRFSTVLLEIQANSIATQARLIPALTMAEIIIARQAKNSSFTPCKRRPLATGFFVKAYP